MDRCAGDWTARREKNRTKHARDVAAGMLVGGRRHAEWVCHVCLTTNCMAIGECRACGSRREPGLDDYRDEWGRVSRLTDEHDWQAVRNYGQQMAGI